MRELAVDGEFDHIVLGWMGGDKHVGHIGRDWLPRWVGAKAHPTSYDTVGPCLVALLVYTLAVPFRSLWPLRPGCLRKVAATFAREPGRRGAWREP